MKKIHCVEKQAGPQAGFEIDYADTMCRDCAQGIEIKGEVQGLDIKQTRRERREFKYKNKRRKVQGKDKYVGAQGTVPVDEHVRPAVITEGKEGEEMAKCLVKDCEREGKHRGLCSAHIQRYRKGTLPGVEPLPSNRGKSTKKDRLEMIKAKAEGSRLKAVGEEKDKSSKLKAESSKEEIMALVAEPMSADIITAEDIQLADNSGAYKKMAVAFINLVEKKFLQETFDALFAASDKTAADERERNEQTKTVA